MIESELSTATEVATTEELNSIPVQFRVEWFTTVLQKFRCVPVAPQYTKTGASSIFIAMGWDTEGDVENLDLDLSLVPLDGKKTVLKNKMVYYNQKTPRALSCGYGARGLGMQAFNDDRSGDEPGDDELVKIDLACLNQFHRDVEAVVVMVNIFAPRTLTWSSIDSAYLRIISGGREMSQSGNFFVHDAEAVRSFVRLSGEDLKADPDLANQGLAVGMFFRQPDDTWAFGALMKGMGGQNVERSAPALQTILQDLVYPANTQWDKTQEQKAAMDAGAFGQNGMQGKATLNNLISNGELPCISSRTDQALLKLGHMNQEALQQVATNAKVPKSVQNLATKIQNGGAQADQIRKMAQGVDKMEKAHTEAERKEIASTIGKAEVTAPTAEESTEALSDLDDLFDDI